MKANWRLISIAIIIASLCCVGELEVEAGGISTTFAKVSIKNLSLGNTYRVSKLANKLLVVKNNTLNPTGLEIKVIKPRPTDKFPEGCEAIPDISWIRLDKYAFQDIKPGEEAKTDVIISIPDNPDYKGKKYMVYILSRTSQGMMRLALKSMLILEIYDGDSSKVNLEQVEPEEANFLIEPESFLGEKVVVGRKYSFKELGGRQFKITNMNEKKLKESTGFLAWIAKLFGGGKKEITSQYKITSIAVPKYLLSENYQPLPDPSFIKFKQKQKKSRSKAKKTKYESKIHLGINGKDTEEVEGYIEFDGEKADIYKGKKYVFAIEIKSGKTKRYVRGFIDVAK